MKRAIIIPTFSGHFKYVKDFLCTYQKNVYNSQNVDINFILSNTEEKAELEELISNYDVKNIFCYSIIDILNAYNIKTAQIDLLEELGKFSYQTIKKLYAAHYLKYEQSLILDSESLICARVNINKLFDNYFRSPYVFYSNMPDNIDYVNSLDYQTSINVSKILNIEFDHCWYLEGFHWFYDINILNDLFKFFNDNLFDVIYNFSKNKVGFSKAVFECILYYKFIKMYNSKYQYNYVNSTEILKNQVSKKELSRIANKMIERNCKNLPFTIHGFEFGKVRNIVVWAKFLKKYKCQIIRLYPIKDANKLYIIKKMIYDFQTKIICSTDNVGMYKDIAIKKNYFFIPLIFSEDCNQW